MPRIVQSFASVGSSSAEKSKPTRLDFNKGWGRGSIFDWYKLLKDPQAKSIKSVQVRKDLKLNVLGEVDIITVISACFAMHTDENTKKYSFLRYNCFFFSWTILMVVSRYDQPYEIPSTKLVIDRFQSTIDHMTTLIVDEAITLFLDLVVDTITIIRDKAADSLNPGMSVGGRLVWAMPIKVLRFFWRRLFNARLHCGLRAQLTKMVKKQVIDVASKVHETTLSSRIAKDNLNKHLWIEDIEPEVKKALEEEAMKVLWKAIIEAISSGLATMAPGEIEKQILDPSFKFSLLGKDVRQFCAVSSAALNGGLLAARDVQEGFEGLKHEESFNKAWDAASQGALAAAKIVAEHTGQILKNKPERIEMYQQLWRIWDDCWAEARELTRPRSVRTVEVVMETLMASGANAMIQELKSCGTKVEASVPNKASCYPAHSSPFLMAESYLVEHEVEVVKSTSRTIQRNDDLQAARDYARDYQKRYDQRKGIGSG
ncbi:unnamed protein product [Rhizoctonia solani]|uniref:Uncharacterized protein n=1 Tax=Rhizoctonia solani TaxID=456999 RepID=A0A8H2Y140_9AGAM|nr:unnamed protein product [Rhizoctonia solani]